MADKKKKSMRDKVWGALDKSLTPIAYSYDSLKKVGKEFKKTAPLVYQEIENFLKTNLVNVKRNSKLFDKKQLANLSDTITSEVIKQLPHIDEKEIKKIVKGNKSQSFIDMLSKSLSVIGGKDYTTLPKNKRFKRVMIANRGEIALRVIRACRELGIETVLVYTNPDKNSLAVKYADISYNLGDKLNYLDYKKIVSVAKKAKADAIHPGYGFLAENAEFARTCEKNKIKFIGPSSRAISLLGDKVKAKKTCIKADVPIVPGTTNPLKNKQEALKLAKDFGFPIIMKAAAGGGGKGMRIVRKEEEVEEAFESAQAEAYMSFKDKTMYMEKYVEEPRHIEFQMLADQHGNVVHFGERDCSVQRKHQKLIEEAPSPALDENLRERMGEAAVRVCKYSKYEGAGTVEFLLDKDKNFYFIEMNTRIQVEHGVTEMITGVDLIKEQIKVAAGAILDHDQDDIKIDGWAIECRINAEDPLSGFAPSIGTVRNYLPPGGPGIRLSSSGYSGYKIEPHYDSLISLLICHGSKRKEAISRMKRALQEYVIDGVDTTIPFHLAVLNNKTFVSGNVTTAFIEKEKILQCVKDFCWKEEKELTDEQKVLVVSTAVAKYKNQKKNAVSSKPSAWALAGRQDQMEFSEN